MPAPPDVLHGIQLVATAYRRKNRDPDEIAAAHTALNQANTRAFAEKTLAGAPHIEPETWMLLAILARNLDAAPKLTQDEIRHLHGLLDEAAMPRLRAKRAEHRAAVEGAGR